MRYWLWLSLLLLLTACGFQPRGEITLAPPLKNIYLKTPDPYGQLARNLRSFLKMSNVHLADTATSANTVLVILKEQMGQDLVSVSGTQLTRQYNLTLNVTYQVTDAEGKILVSPQTSTEVRSLTIQSDQILGGSNEANSLYTQMQSAIVYDIMYRLSSKEITAILNPTRTKKS
jgi:LPS-assembly lipoprotein